MKHITKMTPGTGSTLKTPVLAVAIALASGSAWASGTLKDLAFASGPGGSVDLTLTLSEPVGEPPVFTMDDPPRIVLDLPDTTNGLTERRRAIGVGATSSVSTAEAAGKTRVSIDLFRSAPYQVRTARNQLILSIGGGSTAASAAVSNDPAKRLPATTEVVSVDFRRSSEGSGRLILKLTGEGAASEMSVDGSAVRVMLTNESLPDSLAQNLGAAAADPHLGAVPLALAFVLFLWTPPHFWSLAIAFREDYKAAGVPMLPVVVGDQRAAQTIFYSTLALVAASFLPLAFGLGAIYAIGAAAGGFLFIQKAWRLAQEPTRKTAMACFFSSLVQLTVVLLAAILDARL